MPTYLKSGLANDADDARLAEQARGFVLVARSEMLPQGGYNGSAERGKGIAIGRSDTFNVFAGVLNAAWSAAGLRIAAANPRSSWQLTAERGTGWIDLPALLRREVLETKNSDGQHAGRWRGVISHRPRNELGANLELDNCRV